MSKIVRSSKYRHVFGKALKSEECYDDLRVTRSAWDTDLCSASPTHFAVCWEAGGGGSFALVDYKQTGKWDQKNPLVAGHKSSVLDVQFNPFNDNLVGSTSEDATCKIWGVPEGPLTSTITDPLQSLIGHKRKVGQLQFNPVANNILATSSTDYSIKVWDIEKGSAVLSVDAQHNDIIQSMTWNSNGSLLASSCKDKQVRLIDPRKQEIAQKGDGHPGVKGSRVLFLKDRVFTVGFSKSSEREWALWDPRDLAKPLKKEIIDTSSGGLMPFFDADTSMVFLAGKGDGNIRYYEFENDNLFFLDAFKTNNPQRGIAMVPKRAVNVSGNEVVKMLKIGVKGCEPISFQVPRKSDIFQDDIFPDCFSGEPALQADAWIGGSNAEPKTRPMAPDFKEKPKPAAEFKPVVQEKKELSEKEVRKEHEELTKRVAYLEAELIKRDNRIKELEK